MTLLLAWLAGGLSTLSPCVLPLIPVLVAGALQGHRWGPLALAAGLSLSYAAVGLLLAAIGGSFAAEALRSAGAVVMVAFGAVLMVARWGDAVSRALGPLANAAAAPLGRIDGRGLAGQAAVGALLGIVWSPCVGPTLGAAVGLALTADGLPKRAATLVMFGLGAATPLLLLGYGARAVGIDARRRAAAWAAHARTGLGAAMALVGLAALTGADRWLEAQWVAHMPHWLLDASTRL